MKHRTAWLASIVVLVAALLVCLNYFTPADASPEWVYTLRWINVILSLCLLPAVAVLIIAKRDALKIRHKTFWSAICFLLCGVFFAMPALGPDYRYLDWRWQYLFSGCWALAFLFAGLFLFLIASRASAIFATALCLAGSLFLGLATMESVLLCTSQAGDGLAILSALSKHARQNDGVPEYENWTGAACGAKPAPSGGALPSFHRQAVFENDIFDVKYTFDKLGRRKLPQNMGAQNDLLLFGCSFTFGMGLEDEQTWAWQLAQRLGPAWLVVNYAANGYSANHMLCLLEHGLIEAPQGNRRYALFLALDQHLKRNEFYANTPHYRMNDNGEAEAGGEAKLQWVSQLPRIFNGSQLAREASTFITGAIMKFAQTPVALYLAMLEKSARLLESKYQTKLMVLIWPGLEELAPQLEQRGIPTLMAETMLPAWHTPEDPGWKYRIDRTYDSHPNSLAASELATGLAHYFQNLLLSGPQAESVNG